MKPPPQPPRENGQRLLTLETAAARLGVTVARLRGLIACGAIRTLNISGARFVPEGELDSAQQRLAGEPDERQR